MAALIFAVIACIPDNPGESGPTESAVEHSGETGETGDSGNPEDCGEPVVTFVGEDATETDLTAPLLAGTYTTLDAPGTLRVCPGTWFARLLIRADVHVEGLGSAPEDTVLSAGEQGTILDVMGPDVLLTVQNVTLDRGAGLDVEHNSGGGGVYFESEGSVLVEDVIFSNNVANDGPGMYVTRCTIDLTRVVFRDNYGEDDGGALTMWFSEGTLTDVVFENNEALEGGAVAMFESTFSASGLEIRDNLAHNFGGGMWIFRSQAELTDTVFESNVNDGTNGAGLLFNGTGALTRVDFHDNVGVRGGGIFLYWESVLTGEDCDFSGNTPNDIWVADYSDEEGHAVEAGEGYSFSCAGNECSEQ